MRIFKNMKRISSLFGLGTNEKGHTILFRPPGVRAVIINDEGKILLNKEYREEYKAFDYRLPGGKVFDDIDTYIHFIADNEKGKEGLEKLLLQKGCETVVKECYEEVGFKINGSQLINISSNGYTVDWDLYYFLITDYDILSEGPQYEDGEIIDGYEWFTKEEILQLWKCRKINEERSSNVLLHMLLDDKICLPKYEKPNFKKS